MSQTDAKQNEKPQPLSSRDATIIHFLEIISRYPIAIRREGKIFDLPNDNDLFFAANRIEEHAKELISFIKGEQQDEKHEERRYTAREFMILLQEWNSLDTTILFTPWVNSQEAAGKIDELLNNSQIRTQ